MAIATPVVILSVSGRGAELAARIRARTDADVMLPERLAIPPDLLDPSRVQRYGAAGVRAAIADIFARYRSIVLILPVGAAVRLIAPHVGDKHADPGVVAVDEAGAYAIALLSGHAGGGNALASEVASVLGAQPIITTAAEVLDTLALDLLGQAWGWTIADGMGLTRASAALLGGEAVAAYQDAGETTWWQNAPPNLTRYASLLELAAAPVAARLVISDQTDHPSLPAPCVVYRPRTLMVGAGCVRGATADEIAALLDETLARHKLAPESVRALATIDRKRDEPGMRELAAQRGWELLTYTAAELSAVGAPSGASAAVQDAVGAPGVCEPAALLAAGARELLVPKTRTNRVTVAVARMATGASETRVAALTSEAPPWPNIPSRLEGKGEGGGELPLAPTLSRPTVTPAPHLPPQGGQEESGGATARTSPGCLALVGIGPGGLEGLTIRARDMLEAADVVIGYDGYLELLRPWLVGPDLRGSPIGAEVERAQLAIDLARAGRRVALVSSGDAGVYGTAGIVFELLGDAGALADAPAIEVIPGVSAAHAAAALLGAPLMNDYVAISLSDLMTPWEVIERRLRAAAEADFVVALYNPMSGRRRTQLVQAQAILLAHRPSDTPVGLVRNAGRAGESVRIVRLGELLEQDVDMLTIVIVGNRATVRFGDRLVTRRGYLTTAAAGASLARGSADTHDAGGTPSPGAARPGAEAASSPGSAALRRPLPEGEATGPTPSPARGRDWGEGKISPDSGSVSHAD